VQAVCDRVALFNRGKIAIEGTVEALSGQVLGGGYGVEIEAVGTNLTKVFGGIDGVLRVTEAGNGKYNLVASRDIRAELGAAIVASGGALMRLDHIEPSLDTVYRHYFEGQQHGAA
jgi:ABC-2 type transport system ATP-binding protein